MAKKRLSIQVLNCLYAQLKDISNELNISFSCYLKSFLNDKESIELFIKDLQFDIDIINDSNDKLVILYKQTITELTEVYNTLPCFKQ